MNPDFEAEVCVIGSGVLGGFTALSLAEEGVSVIVLDRGRPGSGASGANPGTVAIQNKHFGALPLVLEGMSRWEQVADRLGTDVGYERRGGFRVAESEADVEKLERAVAAQREAGVNTELLSGSALFAEAPYLGRSVRAASYSPDDGMADSLRTVRGLVRRLGELGVARRNHCTVRRIEALGDHDFRVVTDSGTVRCRWVVCAAGGWTRALLQPLGIHLPLTFEIMIASITDQLSPLFHHVVTHVQGRLTLKQQPLTGKILIGGGWNGDGRPETGDHRLNLENLRTNLRLASAIVPEIGKLQIIRAWSGIEGRSPDRLLVIGPVAAPKGVFVLCTAAGGFTISPFAGELAARWIRRGDPGRPLDAYHVQRFATTAERVNPA